ncbi:complex I 30 kDa subunit family protein [Devosia aurantiaca]|uniref:complex I 30 kDa subunit family protein n=1 Tax=Devosia aurantiaca TaxID=2714858 RepID=UPI0038B3B8D0
MGRGRALSRDDPQCRFIAFPRCLRCGLSGARIPLRRRLPFLSPHLNHRVRVKLQADDETPVPSICDIYPGANWFEREALRLFGVLFSGHPDLRGSLPTTADGHPLRKDFPMTGFVEVRYDEERRRVVYEPVALAQNSALSITCHLGRHGLRAAATRRLRTDG